MVATGILPLPLATAQAQSSVSADTRDAITVTAPYKRQTGRSATGAPIEIMEAQSIVYIRDLNLATQSGRNELRRRVAAGAESACKWLDEVFPPQPTSTSTSECRRDAIARARPQMDAAIGLGG